MSDYPFYYDTLMDHIIDLKREIEYLKEDGTKIHSDICPPNCDSDGLQSQE